MDAFICTLGRLADDYRFRMLELVHTRWQQEHGANVSVLQPPLGMTPREFQGARRKIADMKSEYGIYFCADDDCLPGPAYFADAAADCLRAHPEFGMLSLMPYNAKINPWTPDAHALAGLNVKGGAVFEDDHVMEHVSVGNIRVCRKSLIPSWPPVDGPGYDLIHCAEIRRLGYRVGYIKNITYLHLGEGYSTLQ